MSRRWVGAGLLAVVATILTMADDPAAGSPAQPAARTVRWLAMGDSYSSGEGIPGTNPGNPQLQGQDDCARANGDGTDAKAWAVVAVENLAAVPGEYRFEPPFFVACTGAITDGASTQLDEMRAQIADEDLRRFDVVSLSFGGNNLRFREVIKGCIDLSSAWEFFDLTPGCDIDETELRSRIDMLTGTRPIVPESFEGQLTLPELYDRVASAVAPGGHVIVTGYPQLVEEVERWDPWRRNLLFNCESIRDVDVPMLRSVGGYLNEQTALAVQAAAERWAEQGITFHFVDAAAVYESEEGRHGLCSAEPWLNGLTIGVTSGDFRVVRSFHPHQTGHDELGRSIARLVSDLTFPDPVVSPIPEQDVQLFLNMLGYGPLAEDGILGPASTEALTAFQRANDVPDTGQPDRETIDLLIDQAGAQTFGMDACDNELGPEPGGIVLACSLSQWVDVTWDSWTAVSASGSGVYNSRACDPSCVQDQNVESMPVAVEFLSPERWRCGDAPPYQIFTELRLTGEDGESWTVPVGEFYSC